MRYYLAIDIGASSGRHILGHLECGRLVLEEVYRFDNLQMRKNDHDCWDLDNLWREILNGLRVCKQIGKIPDQRMDGVPHRQRNFPGEGKFLFAPVIGRRAVIEDQGGVHRNHIHEA